MMTLDFTDETNELTEEQAAQLESLLEFAAGKEGIADPCELSLTIVNNDKIHEINREYRGVDRPTDVISFALEEGEEMEISGVDIPRILGDIIISVEKAHQQAEEYGHSFIRELGFLAVHGFLHLLGYDHMTEEDEKEMFRRQEEILHNYGLTR